MTTSPGLAALGAVVLTLAGACAQGDDGAPPQAATTGPGPTTTVGSPDVGNEGVTDIGDIYGPSCDDLPTSGDGSADAMAEQPAGAAVAGSPLLMTLTRAFTVAQLRDTLNDSDAAYTVFAPADSAFDKLPPGALDKLLSQRQGALTEILSYHVVPRRYDAAGLVQAGEVSTVLGKPLDITGDRNSLTVGGEGAAGLLCGNIPTTNATIFIVDDVLMPPPP